MVYFAVKEGDCMPYKDPAKRKEASARFKAKSMPRISVIFSVDEKDVFHAMESYCKENKIPLVAYCRTAIREKLKRDKLIPE